MIKNIRLSYLPVITICALVMMMSTGLSFAKEFPKIEISDAPNIVPNHGYTMSFIRSSVNKDNEATLRIIQPSGISGCISIFTPKPQLSIIGSSAKVIISAPIIKFNDEPQYGNNICKKQSPSIVTNVILNRDTFIEKNIKKITFSGPGGSDTYDLHVDTNKIYFFKKIKNAKLGKDLQLSYFDDKHFFKPDISRNHPTPLTHWFYPENVVILSVPSADNNQDVSAKLKQLASKKGFIKLETLLPGFKPPTTDKNTLYFVDQTGITAKSLSHNTETKYETISVSETFYGTNGAYERSKELHVIAKLPGTFD
ncbi:MAG: hypothetical protein KAJ86_06670 [Alphaproteobacteria bacterium]|nr:hypothetical protein [Alphaproteobacteria bacterium]